MNIGVIGTGYVFDHYMTTRARHPRLTFSAIADRNQERAEQAGKFYGIDVRDTADILSDPDIQIVVNLTSIESHFEVTKAALEAGKHVYSEKPLTTSMEDARALADLAHNKGLHLSSAPSNALSPTVQTLWSIVDQGHLGEVRMVYAEFDDNPVYLLNPEKWASRSGAPWPYLHEYEMGCTWEHVGYHLVWMCALFGPVRAVTAFSKHTLPDKTKEPLSPNDTPDFSVACLDFESGVVGRITCSIAAPADHKLRIFGNRGMATADTYRHYECPVYLEQYTDFSLKARNMTAVRRHPSIAALFGAGGRSVPLVKTPPPGETAIIDEAQGGGPKGWLKRLKRAQFGQQDKCMGLADLADAIATERQPFSSVEFNLHVTELTLAIQAAGENGATQTLTTRFEPFDRPERTKAAAPDYSAFTRPAFVPRTISRLLRGQGARSD